MTGINYRIGVGHRYHRGKSAGGGCPRPAGDVFFPLLSGLAEMDVQVDESRPDPGSAGIERLLGVELSPELGDPPVNYEQVVFEQAIGGEHSAVANGDGVHWRTASVLAESNRKSTAIRVATPLV